METYNQLVNYKNYGHATKQLTQQGLDQVASWLRGQEELKMTITLKVGKKERIRVISNNALIVTNTDAAGENAEQEKKEARQEKCKW